MSSIVPAPRPVVGAPSGGRGRRRRGLVSLGAVVALVAVVAPAAATSGRGGVVARASAGGDSGRDRELDRARAAYGRLPLRFEVNRGQTDPAVRYLARGSGYTAFLTGGEAVLGLTGPGGTEGQVRLGLVGARGGVSPRPEGRLPGVSNYLTGTDPSRWTTGVPGYARVRYAGVYPGIDLVWHGRQRQLKYDFEVAPGADPGRIALGVQPATGVSIDGRGDLVITTPAGPVRHRRPVVYQLVDGRRRPVTAAYARAAGGSIGFRLGRYDAARPLVIDPAVVYSSHLGGSASDFGNGIALDGAGSAYVTGQTSSANFPSAAAFQGSRLGTSDAFVTKLSPAGGALVYSTYLGGANVESGNAIAVDGAGSAYVAGETRSDNFPTASPHQVARGGGTCGTAPATFPCPDAFVVKLNPAGSGLAYSTYLGGAGSDIARGVALDGSSQAHVTGETATGTFPTLNALQPARGGGSDAFVARFGPAGALAYSTYLGGSGADVGRAVAVEASGAAYVTGDTASTTNFPVAGPLQATSGGGTDAFVTKIDAAGSALAWSTYLGGAGSDTGKGIAVDGASGAYVAGETASTNFPTAAPFQASNGAGTDAFVTKIDAAGSALAYSTYLGGRGSDTANAVAVDGAGGAHVAGSTNSGDFPVANPIGAHGGNTDPFVLQLTPAGTGLVHATYVGGASEDFGNAVAVDAGGNTYVAGSSVFFAEADLPTANPAQPAPGGLTDAVVFKVSPVSASLPSVTGLAPRGGPPEGGTTVVIRGSGFTGASAVRFGTAPAASFTVVSPSEIRAVSPAQGGGPGTVVVTVTTAAGTSPANPVGRFTYGEGRWERTGSLTAPRFVHTATLLADGKVLVAGGRDRQAGAAQSSAELYDPRTGTWAPTGSMATARLGHTATLLADGRVLVAGGFTGDLTTNAQPVLDSAELYDPATGTWATTGAMATRRSLHAAQRLPDGRVLVAGGRTCTGPPPATCNFSFFTKSAEIFDPATGTWIATGPMAVGRHTNDAALLRSGKVLVPAGFGDANAGTTAEVYDPATGTWTMTGPLSSDRARGGATLLRDGRVLVVAGFGGANTAEVYDPATNGWTAAGGLLSSGRFNFWATALPNGRVLVAGGGNGGATAEVYDPAGNRWRSAGLMHVARGSSSSNANSTRGVVLSSHPDRLEADPAVCGANCGKVLVAGNSDDRSAELYTPPAEVTDKGYWLVASDGGVFAFGGAQFHGSTGAIRLNQPMVGMASTPSGRGYWTVAADGGIFAFGPDAGFYGSTGAIRLNQPVVGMAATPSGKGYWLVAADGGIFAFGDARFHGSTGGIRLNRPVVGMAATRTGRGYWLVASDGGVFAFGDAAFHGSTGAIRLNQPMVGMAATATGKGYALVAADGGVFAFGDAAFHGSTGAIRLNQPMVGMAATPSKGPMNGYWLVAADGGVFAFGDAAFLGSTGAIRLNRPMVGMAPMPPPTG